MRQRPQYEIELKIMKDRTDGRFARQHGVISRAEAMADGLTHRQIQFRVASGIWIAVNPGVYRHPAHPTTPEQLILAAVLAGGPGAVASHQAAAYLWKLLDWREAGRAAVTVVSPSHRRNHGFDLHRVRELDWARVRTWKGIECTDPWWTLADLGAAVDGALLDQAIDRGLANRLVTVRGLEAEIARRSKQGRRGVGILRNRLAARGFVGAPHPSVLESRTLAFLARYRIPVESSEIIAGPDGEYRVDFCLVHPVMLEVDGYVWHYSPEHTARDEERRNALKLTGIELYVWNWLLLRRRGPLLARQLRQAIDQIPTLRA
jgi:hypothetical protein